MALDPKQKEMQAHLIALTELQKKYTEAIKESNDINEKAALMQEMFNERQQRINSLQANYDKLTETQQKRLANLVKIQEKEYIQLKQIEKEQKLINDAVKEETERRKRNVDLATALFRALKEVWKQLQLNDKIIKTTILNLGMSGTKAEMMRTSFEQSAGFVTRLGGTLEDIQTIMEGYADETGRARALSAEMVKDIELIGKGTGLGVEQATRLGAQFELMGYDAKSTMEYVQGVVDTSERMGVNTTKVLKNINDNFKKLNTFTFQQGVKGFAQMAEYAEKFKIDIGDALNAATVAKSLEGAVDLAAQLQVMGGEFAKTDPFEMLFLSRNDPAKFTEKIADMTKGVVTFRKMTDSAGKTVFEKFISPADRDRLANVAKSLGMEASQLTQIAERQAEIQKMRQQMQGMGLSEEQKKLIEGAATFDTKSGKFQVQLAGTMRDISTLTKDQAKAFEIEQVSLKERAKQAMTFDETLKATIETLKSALLPLLRGINVMLKPLSWIADQFSKLAGTWGGVAAAATTLLIAGGLWKTASILFNKGIEKYVEGGLNNILSNKKSKSGSLFTKSGSVRKGAPELISAQGAASKGAGMKALGQGAGFGAAMVGAGAGIAIAATGISKLADSMSKLTDKQAETLKSIVGSLGLFIGIAAGLAAAIGLLGTVAGVTAGPMLAFGGAIALIGAGVGIAAAGIGYMGQGLGEMFKNIKGAGDDFLKVASGIGMIGVSLAGVGMTLPAALGLAFAVGKIAKHAESLDKVGIAFGNIKAVMSGSKDDFVAVQNAVESISKLNTSGGGMLAELATLLKSPLKVQFVDKEVAMVTNITMEIDGQKLFNKSYNVPAAIEKHINLANKGVR